MTQAIWSAVPLSLLVSFAAACAPAPVAPRAAPSPSPEEARPDADVPPPAVSDAGAADAADSGSVRQKLPPPDAIPTPPGADAGAETVAGDAGLDARVARPPDAGEIAVVEVLVNPGGQDTGREWIEILNRATEPLDLSDLHLADAATDVAAPAGVVPGGGRLVLGQS